MATRLAHARRAKASILDRMDILYRSEAELPSARQVFETVNNILALVKVRPLFSASVRGP